MSTTKSDYRTDITWKEIGQAVTWALLSETEALKGSIYESLVRFPIIDWEYAHKRALYHTTMAGLLLMKAGILIYKPSSKTYRKIAIVTTDLVEEWIELNA